MIKISIIMTALFGFVITGHGITGSLANAPERTNSAEWQQAVEFVTTTPSRHTIIAQETERNIVRTDKESIGKGKNLFEKVCMKCHDAYSDDHTIVGPGLKGLLQRDVLPVSKKPATAENVLNQLNRPYNKMPSFHWISEEEKLNILAFLNTL